MEIKHLGTDGERQRAYAVLHELRPHLTLERFLGFCRGQDTQPDGYRALGIYDGQDCCAFMGYRIIDDFVHGRHVYVDDLVTKASHRGRGIGARLLKQAELIAQGSGCTGLRLCTGIDNDAGKRFYEREGWNLRAVAFKKSLAR